MHAIGVDIGGTKIAAGVVDDEGRILAQLRRDTDPTDAAAVDAGIVEVVAELCASYEVGAIGLAAPGFVSSDRATVLLCPNLPWRDHPLRDNVAAVLTSQGVAVGVPIVVENDANAAGWAEYQFGAGRGVRDMVLLTIGTGLGGALVVDGHLVRGAFGVAAELGHMRVVPNGQLCGCGLHGCWEQYASGRALVRLARNAAANSPEAAARVLELSGGNKIKGPAITTAAQEGDAFAIAQLAELGRWIGEGSASVASVLDPALFVIGGGVADAGELLLAPTREAYVGALSARGFRPEARIELASMGNDAGIVGAADLARQ